MPVKSITLLDTEIACATYESAFKEVCDLARRAKPAAVSASNTHIVSAARHDREFARVLRRFDMVLPDGMPLVWTLNLAGARLRDRVYGPYFMRHVIENAPQPWRHFFFGGRPETLDNLCAAARTLQPKIEIAGAYSPPFREWTEEDQEKFGAVIGEADADFIWVALGGERQERWIIENQHRFRRGVFFAVGDAFELLAGHRRFAPSWMQRTALTWVFRLWHEPARLWQRYCRYNALYLWYLLVDGVRGRAFRRTAHSPLRIAFIGSRGAPARYSGFETVVEELGARLSERGHSVTVYNRPSYYPDHPTRHRGMDLIYLPTIMSKSLETIVHTILSFLHALTQRFDVIYLCGVGNAPLAWMARLNGRKVLINTDGIDFRRRKWRGFARWWLRKSERMAVLFAHRVIVDNGEVAKHYKTAHRHTPECIPYGSTGSDGEGDDSLLEKWDLKPAEYILFVSRLTPENDAALLLEAYTELKVKLPLLLVGPIGYEERYKRELDALASPGVVFTGPVYGPGYRTLSRNCRFFVLPAAIEATRLVLLDQMGFGNAIVFRDVPATREVIADAGEPFDPNDSVGSLSRKMALLINQPERCKALGAAAKARATARFDWGPVTDRYEALFQQVMARRQRRRAEGGVRNEGNEERGRAAA